MITQFENNFIGVFEQILNKKYNFLKKLNYFHEILETKLISDEEKILNIKINELGNDRRSLFLNDYHEFVDNNPLFNQEYHAFIEKYVKPLYSNSYGKILVQKTPNLRISFTNSSAIGKNTNTNTNINNDVIGIHKDKDFGHHDDVINFIIPITEMFETNSIYYEPSIDSNVSTEDYLNLKLNTNEFFIAPFNKLLHFNKINQTGVTRMSLDFRIIPYEKYIENLDFFKNTKFELGSYYILL